jgi:hypothetical protein
VFTGAPARVEPTAVDENATGAKRILKFNDFLIGARRSLGDSNNPFLEFTMQSAGEGNMTSLRSFINRLQKLSVVPRKLKNGTEGWALKGLIQFGIKAAGPVKNIAVGEDYDSVGRFEMQLTKDFDLRKVQIVQSVRIPLEGSNVPTDINVSTIWEGELSINSPANQALFKIR